VVARWPIANGCICQKCAERGTECDYGTEEGHDECTFCEKGKHVTEREIESAKEEEAWNAYY
jgi:hypothetical protein